MMDREELILSCQSIVDNLVKKYNNHKSDEDLQSEGMIAVIECVDRCLSENMTDMNQIQARCNVWARNKILTEIYKEKIKYADEETEIEAPEDVTELLIYLEQVLTPRQKEVFDLLCQGYSYEKILEKLNITQPMLYKHCQKIKEKIKKRV